MIYKILDGVINMCQTAYSPCHYMRFLNTKHMYHRVVNSNDLLHSGLYIADETFSLYIFDKHSSTIVTLYGCDWGLESIVLGIST